MSPAVQRSRRRLARAFTLLEVLVVMGIISLLSAIIIGTVQGLSKSRDNMNEIGSRYHQGRNAMDRMARELNSAYISAHVPFAQLQYVQQTSFIGSDSTPADRVDFNAFAHLRLERDSHESDQCEISYFAAADPDIRGKIDLVRRESRTVDDDPTRGGIVQVLVEDIHRFEILYLDPLTGDWLNSWDTTQGAEQLGRLPSFVWLRLEVNNGPGGRIESFETKVQLAMIAPLQFATGN